MAGSAVIAKNIAGYGITLTNTGVDAGTGDVTLNSIIPTTSGAPASLSSGQVALDPTTGLFYWRDTNGVIHSKPMTPEGGAGPILNLSNFTTSGAIGTAAATIDQYDTIRINQTTTGIALSLPNPTLTNSFVAVRVVNIGTVAFSITYNIPPNAQLTLLWNPSLSAWTHATEINVIGKQLQVYASGIYVNVGDNVSYNNVLYVFTGTAGIITTAPVTGANWFPLSPVTAVWFANATQSIANNAATPLNFQTQYQAGDGCFSTTSTAGLVVTLPVTGLYVIKATVEWPGTSATGVRNIAFIANNNPIFQTQVTQSANETTQFSEFTYNGTAGDQIWIALNQTSGGALTSVFNAGPSGYYQCNRLSITLMSP